MIPATTQQVRLADIDVAGSFQPRVATSEERAEHYGCLLAEGVELPPIDLFTLDGLRPPYWIGDGFTRTRAHEIAGLKWITARLHRGNARDAMLFAIRANAAHPYPLSNADKRRTVVALLRDPEGSQWSARDIAKYLLHTVSHETVSVLRKQHAAGLLDDNGQPRDLSDSDSCQTSGQDNSSAQADQLKARVKLIEAVFRKLRGLIDGLGSEGERALPLLGQAEAILREDLAGISG